jgi:low affinity Fe/Cu permease
MAGMFRRLAQWASVQTGSAWYFMAWALGCLGWTIGGALHGFSAGYILVLTVVLSIGTQLQAVLVQNTQIRENQATRLQLMELIAAADKARNYVINAAAMSDEELDQETERRELLAELERE